MFSVAVFTALGMSFCAQTIHGLMCCWLFKAGVQILDFWGGLTCIPTHYTVSYSGGYLFGWP